MDPKADTVPEPMVIIDVFSRTTEDHDSGAEWLACQTLSSLRHVVLVAQDRRFVALYSREGADWRYRTLAAPDAVLSMEAIGAGMSLSDIDCDSGV